MRVCCGPNAGMSLIYYHLRGWWCSGSVMWCCCCRSAAGSSKLRCASLFWNSCRLKEVAARGGGPLRLRGTWHGLGRYSLVPRTTGCLARPGAMPGHSGRGSAVQRAGWLAAGCTQACMHTRTGAARYPYADLALIHYPYSRTQLVRPESVGDVPVHVGKGQAQSSGMSRTTEPYGQPLHRHVDCCSRVADHMLSSHARACAGTNLSYGEVV